MRTKDLTRQWGGVAVFLVLGLTLLLGGCTREREIEGEGADVKIEQGPNGTEIEVDRESQVEQNLEQAGQDLRQAGQELQQAGREAGHQLDENTREARKDLREGLEEAGEAIEEGARQVGREVEPVAREVLSDFEVTAKVKTRLAADPDVAAVYIDVDTIDGRVTLNGKVKSAAERAEAEKLAMGTEGVRSVVNLIQVVGQAPPAPPTRQ